MVAAFDKLLFTKINWQVHIIKQCSYLTNRSTYKAVLWNSDLGCRGMLF